MKWTADTMVICSGGCCFIWYGKELICIDCPMRYMSLCTSRAVANHWFCIKLSTVWNCWLEPSAYIALVNSDWMWSHVGLVWNSAPSSHILFCCLFVSVDTSKADEGGNANSHSTPSIHASIRSSCSQVTDHCADQVSKQDQKNGELSCAFHIQPSTEGHQNEFYPCCFRYYMYLVPQYHKCSFIVN